MIIDDGPMVSSLPLAANTPAITRTCNALRQELLPYYYRSKVDLDVRPGEAFQIAGKWLNAIGAESRRMIRGLELRTRDACPTKIKFERSADFWWELELVLKFKEVSYRNRSPQLTVWDIEMV